MIVKTDIGEKNVNYHVIFFLYYTKLQYNNNDCFDIEVN